MIKKEDFEAHYRAAMEMAKTGIVNREEDHSSDLEKAKQEVIANYKKPEPQIVRIVP